MQSSRHHASRLALAFLTLTILACSAPMSTVRGVRTAAALDLRQPIPSNAKFALRVPRGAGAVTATGAGGIWAKFEQGLFAAGLEMVDQALLEELLASNPSPSYQQIRERTGADVLIDIGDANLAFHRLDPGDAPYELYCELITVSAKLVDVANGTMLGAVNLTSSSCPADAYQRTDVYGNVAGARKDQLWFCGTGAGNGRNYEDCPAATERYATSEIYLVDGQPRRWVAAGKNFAQSLRERMTGAPVTAASVSPPPAAQPVAAAAPAVTATATPTAAQSSMEDRLAKLKEMLSQGVISKNEHDEMRKKVLADY